MNTEAAHQSIESQQPVDLKATRAGNTSQLNDACCEFEGMLVATILKQGLTSAINEENQDSGNGMLREFALEQTARELGRTGAFGIADLLYQQLKPANPIENTQ